MATHRDTLLTWIAAVVHAHSARPALLDGSAVWSYQNLWERAGGIARHLLGDLCLEPGSSIGIVGANELAYVAVYLGVMRAGCVAVPVNTLLDAAAMREQLALVEAKGVAVGQVESTIREALADALPIWPVRDMPMRSAGRLPQPTPGTPACILLTSGSTGRPKGVVHSQGTLLHAALQMGLMFPYRSDDCGVAFLPFYACFPEQVWPTLCTGGSLYVLPRFDPERVAMASGVATTFDAVPTVMARLLDSAPLDPLRRLRWVQFASEPMPISLLQRWWEALPSVETHQLYGMTELLPLSVASHRMLHAEPATVGVPFPTSHLSSVTESGSPTADGAAGELVCCSPARMLGYFRDAETTAASTTPHGAMRTGDLGRIDEWGRVFLTGRLKDLIITGGLNVAPAEIEAVACKYPGVAAAAVVGIPDDRWGETPVVVAVPTPGSTVSALDVLSYCRAELTSFKRPTGAALMDVLPVTGIGKSDKTVIRKRLVDGEVRLVRST